MSEFGVGQQVICVDASLPLNPWHRQHPLRWGGVYVVRVISPHDSTLISIDSSRRLWEQGRFRQLPPKAVAKVVGKMEKA